MHRNTKISLFFLGTIIITSLIIGQINIAKATPDNTFSTETTGLSLGYTNNKNQFTYINAGGYDIFSTDKKILFYDETDGSLDKTLDTSTLIAQNGYMSSMIVYIDEIKFLLVLGSWYSSAVYVKSYNISISTLTTTQILSDDKTYGGGISGYGMNLIVSSDNSVFLITSQSYSGYFNTVWKAYPTSTGETSNTMTDLTIMGATSYTFQSSTSGINYIVSYRTTGNRYTITKFDSSTLITTNLGESGADNTFSTTHVYFADFEYDSVRGIYNSLVVFPHPTDNKKIVTELIQFNETWIGTPITQTQEFTLATYNTLRVFSITPNVAFGEGYSMIEDNTYYNIAFNYRNNLADYNIAHYWVKLENLSSTPTLTQYAIPIYGTVAPWFPNDSTEHYYKSVASIGGLHPPTSYNMIQFDYTNGKAVVTYLRQPQPSFSYLYQLNPSAHFYSSVFNFKIWKGYSYVYNGFTYENNEQSGSGNFVAYTTGIGLTENIHQNEPETLLSTGTITGGQFSFGISARNSPQSIIYERLKVVITLNDGVNYTAYHDLTITTFTDSDNDGIADEYDFFDNSGDIPNPVTIAPIIQFIVSLVIVFIPAFAFAWMCAEKSNGKVNPLFAFFIASNFMVFLGYSTTAGYLMPLWTVFGVILLDVIMILYLLRERGTF